MSTDTILSLPEEDENRIIECVTEIAILAAKYKNKKDSDDVLQALGLLSDWAVNHVQTLTSAECETLLNPNSQLIARLSPDHSSHTEAEGEPKQQQLYSVIMKAILRDIDTPVSGAQMTAREVIDFFQKSIKDIARCATADLKKAEGATAGQGKRKPLLDDAQTVRIAMAMATKEASSIRN